MADVTYRITLWSGGKPAMVHYVSRPPEFGGVCCSFQTDDGNVIRLMGNISVEQGKFEERPISARGLLRG
ncbi:MAG TPA: hypothetical protein PLO62_14435 [Candidatus Hydrogenedentes bacterium]|nr:hypothetical protein [Candidatus Hydrogenedentota bacterium]HOS02861.1 hypothetical protein [Candidatus Hydrogenedentota bacterium]